MHVHVDLDAIRENARRVRERVDGSLMASVKDVAAHPDVVDAVLDADVDALGVARVEHLRDLQDRDAEAVMLRVPAPSAVAAVVASADRCVHGSATVLERADRAAAGLDATHRVLPLVDAGDRREGVPLEEAEAFLDGIADRSHLAFDRVGLTLGCFGDRPDPAAVHRVADRFPDRRLSVGGSGLLPVADELPDAVSEFRVGDALLTGRWRTTPIPWLRRGGVELRAAVLATRPGAAVVDVGSAVTAPAHLRPPEGVAIERWSTGQTVVRGDLAVGDEVAFEMEAVAVAATFASTGVPVTCE